MNKNFFSMLSLGVFSVAVAGFGVPAEGGLFGFFGHRSHNYDCGSVVDCSPVCGSCDYDDDDDDDDGWCGHGYTSCAPACACPPPVCPPVCACPPPVCPPVCDPVCDCDDDD